MQQRGLQGRSMSGGGGGPGGQMPAQQMGRSLSEGGGGQRHSQASWGTLKQQPRGDAERGERPNVLSQGIGLSLTAPRSRALYPAPPLARSSP